MDLVTIYDQPDLSIKIEKTFNSFLRRRREYVVLSFWQKNYLIEKILDYLELVMELKGKVLLFSEPVPIIKRQYEIQLVQNFSILQPSLDLLQEYFSRTETLDEITEEWKAEIIDFIEENNGDIVKPILHFFKEEVNEVEGFLTTEDEKAIYIIPFAFEEDFE